MICDDPQKCPYILSCTAHHEHLRQDVESLRKETNEQWKTMEKIKDKFDERANQILTRMNVILGGVVVACLILAANLYFK